MDFQTREEAELYCSNNIYKIVNKDELWQIVNIARLYKLEKVKAEAYRKLADISFHEYQYGEAFNYYLKILDYNEKTETMNKVAFLYNRMGACKYAELKYEEALAYFDKSSIFAIMYGDEITDINSTFNSAMCYAKLTWIDKAIEYADLCIAKMINQTNTDKYIYAHIIKIGCYSEKKEFSMALETCERLVESMIDKEGIVAANIYNNMGTFSVELNNYEAGMIYYNKSEVIRREKDTYNLSHTLIDKSLIYLCKKLYTDAEKLLNEGIGLARKNNDHEYVLKGCYLLLNAYEGLGQPGKSEKLYEFIVELVKQKSPHELKKVYLEIAEFYINQGKLDKADEYIELSQ